MPFEQTFQSQYRDADADGLIGLKGAMHYFQDVHTWFMHSMHKGNDELPEKYGSAWVYAASPKTRKKKQAPVIAIDNISVNRYNEAEEV